MAVVPAGATDFRKAKSSAKIVSSSRSLPPTRCAAGVELDGAALVAEPDVQNLLGLADPADPVKKIHMPRAAAELAIGDALEPDLPLHPHDIANRRILDPPQLRRRNPPRLMLPPRPQQLRRPQQTPDMIGAKRRPR